jgi:signal transduction histidine kinase
MVDGDLYGTLCFADDEARATTFTGVERTFVELLTRWVSYELEERAAREELERQNERLSEFASIVSHDIRSPLNVAEGKLQLARETGELSHLSEVERALGRVEDLVTDLLDLARQGTIIESTDEVKLGAVAADAWANVATGDANLVVASDGTIEADRDRLLQLLENLFRNSIEHADALTVSVGVLDRGFYVADTGPGIPPAERGAVFERGHSTNDGTGLGLTIVQAIAEAHGWSVTVTESDAGGARFEFDGVDRPVSA